MEFSILDQDGNSSDEITLTPAEHRRLLLHAGEEELMLLLRIPKYTSDADFDADELDELDAELATAHGKSNDDPAFAATVQRLRALVEKAKAANASVAAIGG